MSYGCSLDVLMADHIKPIEYNFLCHKTESHLTFAFHKEFKMNIVIVNIFIAVIKRN